MLKQLYSMEIRTKDSFTKIWLDYEKQNERKYKEMRIQQR